MADNSTDPDAPLPPKAAEVVALFPTVWESFLAACEAMADPDVELTAEDFALFRELFRQLKIAGVPFDPRFTESVETMAGGYDPDDDASDQWIEDGWGHRPAPDPNDPADSRNWAGARVTVLVERNGKPVPAVVTVYGNGVSL